MTEYSAGSEASLFSIAAKDKCGFRYTAPDARAFSVATQKFSMDYWDPRPPHGVEYPAQAATALSTSIDATPSSSRRCPGAGLPDMPRGDAFAAFLAEPGQVSIRRWEKLRIERLGFGTARQKTVPERWTNPKPPGRDCRSCRYLTLCRGVLD